MSHKLGICLLLTTAKNNACTNHTTALQCSISSTGVAICIQGSTSSIVDLILQLMLNYCGAFNASANDTAGRAPTQLAHVLALLVVQMHKIIHTCKITWESGPVQGW